MCIRLTDAITTVAGHEQKYREKCKTNPNQIKEVIVMFHLSFNRASLGGDGET